MSALYTNVFALLPIKKQQHNFKIQNVTHNQDKGPEEFCQEFLKYSMFQSTVLPHASLLFYVHVSPCQPLLKLPDVQ